MAAASDSNDVGVAPIPTAELTVSLGDLPVSQLYRDYCSGEPGAWEFFPTGDSITDSIERALVSARARRPDRALLASVLRSQNERWGGDSETMSAIGRLEQADSICAVTGQQLGLFVSPMYTLLKAATAIRLARSWRDRGHNAVPMFWLADEDHDFQEVAATYLPCGDSLARVGLRVDDLGVPVGRRRLDEQVAIAVEALAEALPATPFRHEVVAAVHDTYRPGTTHVDAFASLLHRLLPGSGLVLVSGDQPDLKRAASGLLRRDVSTPGLFERLKDRSSVLEARYHAQIRPRDTNLFYLDGDARVAIDRSGDRSGDRFRTDTGREWSADALSREIDSSPEAFSPNVVLRPMMQDMLLPTAAYVGGPGEVSYFAQLGPAYEWAGITMPAIVPRASVTLVDNAALRVMDQHGLRLPDLFTQHDELFARIVRGEMPRAVKKVFEQAGSDVDAAVDAMKRTAADVDATLDRSAESVRSGMHKLVKRLLTKVERAERRQHDELRRRILHAQLLVHPGGGMQERTLSPLYFAARYGLGFFSRLVDRIHIDTTEHQVIRASDV